jgi:hypothetical protein
MCGGWPRRQVSDGDKSPFHRLRTGWSWLRSVTGICKRFTFGERQDRCADCIGKWRSSSADPLLWANWLTQKEQNLVLPPHSTLYQPPGYRDLARSSCSFQGASLVRVAQWQAGQSFRHPFPSLFNSCRYGATVVFNSNEGGVIFGTAIIYSGAGNWPQSRALSRTLCPAVSIVLDKCLSDSGTFVRRHGTMRPFVCERRPLSCLRMGAQDNCAATELG